jgi:glycosyltransferase involved in cell wall biosynthesis
MASTILHLNTESGWRGGEAQTLFLARGLARRGHASIVAAPPGSPLLERAVAAGLETLPVRARGEFDLRAARRVAAFLRGRSIDRLHLHSAHAVGIGSLATCLAGRRPAVASRRVSFPLHGGFLGRLKYTWRVDRVIAVSEAIRRGLIASGLPPERVVTVHSGIDSARFAGGDRNRFRAGLAATGWSATATVIGTAGHLAAHKGIDLFIDAAGLLAKDHPDLRFLVVGTGEEEALLRRRAGDRGLGDRLLFAGFRDDMPDFFAGIDLFVLASTSGEGSPAVLKEAMAAGTPVVSSALDGVEEIIEDARHGLLVPPGSAAALAGAMRTLLEDAALRERLRESGRRRASDFDIEKMVERTEAVYSALGEFR